MPAPFILDPYYNNFQPQSKMTPFKAKTMGYTNEPIRWDWQTCGCSLVFIFLGLFIPFIFAYDLLRDYQYQQHGIDVTVTISDCKMIAEMKSPRPELIYNYTIAGKSYTNPNLRQPLQGQCKNYPIGTELKARYFNTTQPEVLITDERIASSTSEKILYAIIISPFMIFCDAMIVLILSNLIFHPVRKRRYERLLKHGQVFDGEIVQARDHRKSGYYLTVRYRFCAPDGRTLWGKQSQQREDLRGQELPAPGTPVQVYYADKHAYTML